MTLSKTLLAGAALLAVAPAAFAQTGDTMTSTTTATTTTPTGSGLDSFGVPTLTAPEVIDYSVLRQKKFDYTDLWQAKERGFSDTHIASIAKIAELTDQPFTSVSDAVLRGETFPSLALKYNLSLADVYDVSDEKAKIADYKKAYETTGKWSFKALKDKWAGNAPASTTPGAATTNTSTSTTTTTTTPTTNP
jgi:predicted S18 family serine protease